jgi:hypothetical protein
MVSPLRGFAIILRHTTLGKDLLDEGSARRRDLYLTTHSSHNRQTSMPQVAFEPAVLARERLQTFALDRAATENAQLVGKKYFVVNQIHGIRTSLNFVNLLT